MRRVVLVYAAVASMIVGWSFYCPQTCFAQLESKIKELLGLNRENSISTEDYTPPQTQQKIEQEVLVHLSEGRQRKAENVLTEHVKTIPGALEALAFIQRGERRNALQLVRRHSDLYRANQRLLYWYAACERSRFNVEDAIPRFILAGMANRRTAIGQSVFFIIGLDSEEEVRRNPDVYFTSLENLAESRPNEIVLQWMLAVQCRSLNLNEKGVIHYKKLLEKWNPGPVLVHQTYANLLDNLERYDESLVERRKAVAMEPTGWSYDGLGNTLNYLRQFKEADEAHRQATQLSPERSSFWANWGDTLCNAQRPEEAIEKCKTALELELENAFAWEVWGHCLEAKGKKRESLEKYRMSLEIHSDQPLLRAKVDALEKALKE